MRSSGSWWVAWLVVGWSGGCSTPQQAVGSSLTGLQGDSGGSTGSGVLTSGADEEADTAGASADATVGVDPDSVDEDGTLPTTTVDGTPDDTASAATEGTTSERGEGASSSSGGLGASTDEGSSSGSSSDGSSGGSSSSDGATDTGVDPNSCVGSCGVEAPGGCWCDELCPGYGDCCEDLCDRGVCDTDPDICPPLVCQDQAGCPGTDDDDCVCVGCNDNEVCQIDDDCVCPDCTGSGVCGCDNNGICDVYGEDCDCPDCFGHPECP